MLLKQVSFIKKISVNGKNFEPHFKVKLQFSKTLHGKQNVLFPHKSLHTCLLLETEDPMRNFRLSSKM